MVMDPTTAAAASDRPVSSRANRAGAAIPGEDIGPNDVLCGRGKRTYNAAGNVAFRRLAASRKADYLAARSSKAKNAIAMEIVHHVRHDVDPPGRFLRLVDNGSDDAEMWCPVDDLTALEKAKMTLRQKQQQHVGGDGHSGEACDAQTEPASKGRGEGKAGRPLNVIGHGGSYALKPGEPDSASVASDNSRDSSNAPTRIATCLFDLHESPTRPESADILSSRNAADSVRTNPAGMQPDAAAKDDLIQGQINDSLANDGCRNHTTGAFIQTEHIEDENDVGIQNCAVSLLQSVRVALELTKGVQEAHDAGVRYSGSVGVSNPILSDDSIRSDLVTLGSVLYAHFAGVGPFHDSTAEEDDSSMTQDQAGTAAGESHLTNPTKKKFGNSSSTRRDYTPLRDLGFPVSLCIAVSSLLDANDNDAADRYHTAEEVKEDFCLMTSNPERYLFDPDASKLTGQLQFPHGKLYGREAHVSRLLTVFDRVIGSGGAPEMIFISGYSGTGKTEMVEQLRLPLAEKNGGFISGKFAQLGQVQPMSVIFTAFNEFCDDMVTGDNGRFSLIRTAIIDALGQHGNVLTSLIPSLSKVIGEPTSSVLQVGGKEGLNWLLFYFRVFVRAIASPSHPIIVFFDDLQWADKVSLELIISLVSDTEITSLLFVGCYRDNELGLDHPLNAVLRNTLEGEKNACNINLGNIGQESIEELVSDSLYLSPRLTRSLSNIVHSKTRGNPLFVVQFLRSLCDQDLLRYSASSRRWEWNMEAIQSKDISDNVVDLMTRKMMKLNPKVQYLLRVAACLGSRSEASTLKLLSSGSDDDDESSILSCFDLAVSEGLMSRTGLFYKFSHDQIQQAAYMLTPAAERNALHLHTGRLLWKRASDDELNNIVFIVVDQMHRGIDLITDHAEKVGVAGLCLMAGKKAMLSSAFLQASIYLLQGTTLLEERDWSHHYDLCLQLFSFCAEVHYMTGSYEGVKVTSDQVLAKSKCLEDKLRIYYTLLNCLGTRGKQQEAISFGLKVAAELGECFPNQIAQKDVMKEFAKARAMLERTSIDGILQMNSLVDTKLVGAMRLLNIVVRFSYQVNQQLTSLIILRMVQISLCKGVCGESSLGFALFGVSLCMLGKLEEGYRYGKLALNLSGRFHAKEYLPRVYIVVYGQINTATEPLQACLPSLLDGYKTGISTGDIEWALSNSHAYIITSLQCGCNLETLAEETRAHIQQMKEYKHQMLTMTLLCYQTMLNFMYCSRDSTKLTGDAMNQDEVLNRALENGLQNVTSTVYFYRMWLAFFFRRYSVAAEMAELRQEMVQSRPFRLGTVVNETFYTGLIAVVAAADDGDGDKWRNVALDAAEKMKSWASNSLWNFQHKLHLLNAEIAYYLNRDVATATREYDNAIRVAGEHGFIHEQALAYERAGTFYSETVSTEMGKGCFQRSHDCYVKWGAKSKADDVRQFLE